MFNQLNCFDWLENKKPRSGNSFNCGNPILSETYCIQFTLSLDIVLLALSSFASLPFSFWSISCKRNSYSANLKLQVTALAESTNNSMAARRFSINKKLVRGWTKKQNDLSEMPVRDNHYCLDRSCIRIHNLNFLNWKFMYSFSIILCYLD